MTQQPLNHYEVLSLPTPRTAQTTQEDVKRAYRVALLKHHPDKRTNGSLQVSTMLNKNKPSIDAIKAAYATLSDTKLRREYDRELLLLRDSTRKQESFHSAEEVVDLDDLTFDEEEGVWYRACRCGEERGFVVTEQQLEDEVARGGSEVVIGCRGCSLWIGVTFDVANEDAQSDVAGG